MTTDNFCFYLQNKLIQTGHTGGQQYSDTSPCNHFYLSLTLVGKSEAAFIAWLGLWLTPKDNIKVVAQW